MHPMPKEGNDSQQQQPGRAGACSEAPASKQDLLLLRRALAHLAEEISRLREDMRAGAMAGRWAKPFYTVRELAQQLGRSPYTIRRWIREGKIHAVKLNSGGPRDQYLIEHEEVQELILNSGTRRRTLVNTGACGFLRSSSPGKDAGSAAASPESGGPCSDR